MKRRREKNKSKNQRIQINQWYGEVRGRDESVINIFIMIINHIIIIIIVMRMRMRMERKDSKEERIKGDKKHELIEAHQSEPQRIARHLRHKLS